MITLLTCTNDFLSVSVCLKTAIFQIPSDFEYPKFQPNRPGNYEKDSSEPK